MLELFLAITHAQIGRFTSSTDYTVPILASGVLAVPCTAADVPVICAAFCQKTVVLASRQHLSYDDCLEVKLEIIRVVLCRTVCHNCAQIDVHKLMYYVVLCFNSPDGKNVCTTMVEYSTSITVRDTWIMNRDTSHHNGHSLIWTLSQHFECFYDNFLIG